MARPTQPAPPPASPASAATGRAALFDRLARRGWLLAAVLAFVVFLPTLRYGFTYDDLDIVRDNARIRVLGHPSAYILTSWWGLPADTTTFRPLPMASFALNYALGGAHPFGYHLVNNLFAALNAALLWWLAFLVLGRGATAARAATAAALLFAIHAVHVEAVVGVVGRAELMMTAGYLAAMLTAHRSMTLPSARGRWLWAGATLLATFCSVASKEHGATLPAAIALLGLLPLTAPPEQPPNARRRWTALAPALGMAVVAVALYLAARHAVVGAFIKGQSFAVRDNPLLGLNGWLDRREGALAVLLHSAGLMLLPLWPSPNYGLAVYSPQNLANTWLWPLGLGLALLTVLTALVARRRPLLRLGAGLMIVTMALASNLIVMIGTILGERLLYLPSAALCLAAAQPLLSPNAAVRRRWGVVLGVWGLALVVLLGLYVPNWRDNTTLMAYALRRAPDNSNIQLGYALNLFKQGDYARALEHADRAVAIDTVTPATYGWRAVLLALNNRPEAQRQLEQAHAADRSLPYVNRELARIYTERGEPARAERVLREGVQAAPNNIEDWRFLGQWLARQGRLKEARAIFNSIRPMLDADNTAEFEALLKADQPPAASR